MSADVSVTLAKVIAMLSCSVEDEVRVKSLSGSSKKMGNEKLESSSVVWFEIGSIVGESFTLKIVTSSKAGADTGSAVLFGLVML